MKKKILYFLLWLIKKFDDSGDFLEHTAYREGYEAAITNNFETLKTEER